MEKIKISDQIADQLERMIADGSLALGEQLPAERLLAKNMGVSRPSLREAIQKLVFNGLLQVRHGKGTFVTENIDAGFTDSLIALLKNQPNASFDTILVRKELEGIAAHDAALRATDLDRDKIWSMFRNVSEVQRLDNESIHKLKADTKFHLSIIEGAHNVVLLHFMRSIMEVTENTLVDYLDQYYRKEGFVDSIKKQHYAILESIMDRDAEAAKQAAKKHMDFSFESFQSFKEQNIHLENKKTYSEFFSSE